MISALRFVLTTGPRIDRVRSLLVVAVAILEQVTGIGLAVLLGLFSEVASRHSTSGVLPLALCAAIFVVLAQGTFIAGYFTRLRLQEEIQHEVERQFIDVVGTTPTLEIHERSSRSDLAAVVRGRGARSGRPSTGCCGWPEPRWPWRARVPVALAWLFFVLAYATAMVLMVRAVRRPEPPGGRRDSPGHAPLHHCPGG